MDKKPDLTCKAVRVNHQVGTLKANLLVWNLAAVCSHDAEHGLQPLQEAL